MRRPALPPSCRRDLRGHAPIAHETVRIQARAKLRAASRALLPPTLVLTVLLGSVAPAARADDPVRIDDWRISRAMRVAERTWGGLPPDTNIVMVRRDEANRICEHDPGYDPIACAESPDLPSIPGRRIWWNLDAAASWPDADPAYICAVAVHEVGHLLGLGHVDDPHSIMYRGDPLPLPDGCTPTARRHTHRHRACAARRHRRPKCRVRRHVHRHVDWSVR